MSNIVNLSDYTKRVIEMQKSKVASNNEVAKPQIKESKDTVEISTKPTEQKTSENEIAKPQIEENKGTVETSTKPTEQETSENKTAKPQIEENKGTVEINTKFKKAKEQNGWIEKIADAIKGKIGIGLSSKKIQEKIDKGENEETILKDIKNYRRQQENIAQTVADTLTCAAVLFSFSKGKKLSLLESYKSKITGNNIFKSNFGITMLCGSSAAFLGSLSKSILLSLNRIGTSQYKVKKDKDTDKDQFKILKQAAIKDKANANTRNGISGAINGMLAALISTGGGFVGAPLYVILNSLNRYFIASKEDSSEKSVKSYIENMKNSPIADGLSAALILAIATKKGINLSKYEKNIKIAFNKINQSGILNPYSDGKSTYEKLAEVLLNNSEAKNILNLNYYDFAPDKVYDELSQNIFFLKILQIQENKSNQNFTNILASLFKQSQYSNGIEELINKLKMDGPRTYSAEEVSAAIEKAFGKGKYTLVNNAPLGVGTVAETYLVKDASGKELVIKILKKGINPQGEKIAKDAEKCRAIIQNANIPENEKAMLISSFNDIAKGVIKEADLTHEMEAAKKLAKSTSLAQVVKGVEVSEDGTMYVMEKANGECLQKVSDYIKKRNELEKELELIKKGINNSSISGFQLGIGSESYQTSMEYYEKIKQELAQFIESHKGMDAFAELSNDEARTMLELYQDVLVEQFNKVDPNGKTIHADIHPGNIMIDINALKSYVSGDKSAKNKIFTLIDTGNTIEQTPEVATRFLNLSKYIEDADVDNIVSFALEGAKLPNGKIYSRAAQSGENIASKEEMDKYFKEIKEVLAGKDGKSGIFFDGKTALGKLTNETLIEGIMYKILQEKGITPSVLQGNLIKAQTSARNSLKQFKNNNSKTLFKNMSSSSGMSNLKGILKTLKNSKNYRAKQKRQEKANLRKLNIGQKLKMKKSSTAPKKDSVEYLTYILKQDKINSKNEDRNELLGGILESMI